VRATVVRPEPVQVLGVVLLSRGLEGLRAAAERAAARRARRDNSAFTRPFTLHADGWPAVRVLGSVPGRIFRSNW